MIRALISIGVTIFLSGCMTTAEREYEKYVKEYNYLISQPIPEIWEIGANWQFILIDEKEKIVESTVLEFTSETAKTCTSGDWKKVKVISQNPMLEQHVDFIKEPAYQLNGSYFILDFNANLCDAGNELRGSISEQGISGTRQTVHMFGGEHLGKFYAVKISSKK